MGKLEGKVAFITGAARGQGHSHAIRLAEEGADIIAIDICEQIASVPSPLATTDDMAQTVKQVEALGRRIFSQQADVRDEAALRSAFESGVAELGAVDIVLANAAIAPFCARERELHQTWQDVIDVNLTGVFNTIEIAIPSMMERKNGGAIVITSSIGGLTGGVTSATRGYLAYVASKHGLVGLMRAYANQLAPYSIRVNTVHPTGVNTPMATNEAMQEFLAAPGPFSGNSGSNMPTNALPVEMLEPVDISNAIAWLVSDDARYVTGVALPVDAGYVNKH